MSVFDRYVFRFFIKVFLICLISFSGLFVVVDAFTNLDEFLELARDRSPWHVLGTYYGPRVLQLIDKTAAFLCLVSAIFCVVLLQRQNELTVVQASGISDRRIVRPILLATSIIIILGIANRELMIPRYRTQLVMNAQDMAAGKGRAPLAVSDPTSHALIRGQEVMPVNQEITAPEFSFPTTDEGERVSVVAESGRWLAKQADRPAGYVLVNATVKPEAAKVRGAETGDAPVYLEPPQVDWLAENESFVVTDIDTVQLAFADRIARNESLTGMITRYRRPLTSNTNRLRVDIHSRIVQPLFELSVVLIGLPLILLRGDRNILVSAGTCLVVITAMTLTQIACQALGVSRLINPPALAAWIPVIVCAPIAWAMYGTLGR